MWRKLRKQIAVERETLHQLLASFQPLLRKCDSWSPDYIELSALGAMLHSFYGGIENIFKRVVIELGEGMPRGEGWHKELLERMTRPHTNRPAVMSPDLAKVLEQYLDFRHLFRNIYSQRLEWQRMAKLVHGCEETLNRLEAELNLFLAATQDKE